MKLQKLISTYLPNMILRQVKMWHRHFPSTQSSSVSNKSRTKRSKLWSPLVRPWRSQMLCSTYKTDNFETEERRKRILRSEMEGISRLPRDCLSLVLALTSPRDSCRSAAVSTAFLSAAASDAVWERFLPPDLVAILSRAVDPPSFTSRRELYFHLCHHPILIDGGRKSFWLERKTGAKCYEVGARDLSISWSNDPRYWGWHLVPESTSRFKEVAELLHVCWLDIAGRIACRELSPNTAYAAHIIFKLSDQPYGLTTPAQKATVVVGAHAAERQVCLHPWRAGDERTAVGRSDGWMAVKLGEFFNGDGAAAEGEEVTMRLSEVEYLEAKGGLIVRGIEVSPVV